MPCQEEVKSNSLDVYFRDYFLFNLQIKWQITSSSVTYVSMVDVPLLILLLFLAKYTILPLNFTQKISWYLDLLLLTINNA